MEDELGKLDPANIELKYIQGLAVINVRYGQNTRILF